MSVKTATWTAWTPPAGKSITGYKIYSDKDGEVASVGLVLTTPITLSEGVLHNVTCRAVYDDASLGLVSNVEVVDLSLIIEFQDYFAGVTIDTVVKWDLTNVDSGIVVFSQNESLDISSSTSDSTGDNRLTSKTKHTVKCVAFDLKSSTQNVVGTSWQIGCKNVNDGGASTDALAIIRSGSTGKITLTAKAGGVSLNPPDATVDISVWQSFKILDDGVNITFYNWNGSAWVNIGTTVGTIAVDMYFYNFLDRSTNNGNVQVDNIAITSADFPTLRP